MKRTTVLALLIASVASAQQVPYTVMYTGRLSDGGSPATGAYDISFLIFDQETLGTQVWGELHTGVSVDAGLFSVTLGNQFAIDPTVLATGDVWLEVHVDGVPLLPRMKLESVPFAVRSSEADMLGGFLPEDFAPVTASCSAGEAIRAFDGSGNAICETVGGGGLGDITAVFAGIGLSGGSDTGDATLDVDFASFGGCPPGEMVTGWDGTTGALLCGVAGTGTVTLVDTGPGLSGGPITTSGTINLNLAPSLYIDPGDQLAVALEGIGNQHIADGTIRAEEIAPGAVETSEILDGTITFADWSDMGCTDGQIPIYNGVAWRCTAGPPATITIVEAAGNMTPGSFDSVRIDCPPTHPVAVACGIDPANVLYFAVTANAFRINGNRTYQTAPGTYPSSAPTGCQVSAANNSASTYNPGFVGTATCSE